jgi:hypothetical protein
VARYFRRGKSKILFLPAVANKAAPTRTEITAGTSLTPQTAEIADFQFANSPIATPDMDTTFTTSIPGEDTVGTPTITFYDDDAASTIRTALTKGAKGFILLMPYGDVPTKRAEVWPVESTGVNDEWSAGNDPARYAVAFAVTGAPTQNATVPA